MRRSLITAACCALGVLNVGGCMLLMPQYCHVRRDVTGDPSKWGGWRPGDVYRLTRPSGAKASDSETLDAAVLPAGTTFRVTKFVEHSGMGSGIQAFGTFPDGPLAKHEFDLTAMATPAARDDLAGGPDLTKLELVPAEAH